MTLQVIETGPTLELSTEELSDLLDKSKQISAEYLRTGRWSHQLTRAQKEISRLLIAGGYKW